MNWKPVLIEYDDARIENGQIHREEAADLTPVHCLSVGWLVEENERAVAVSMERFVFGDVDEQVRGSLVVPRVAIVRMEHLYSHAPRPVCDGCASLRDAEHALANLLDIIENMLPGDTNADNERIASGYIQDAKKLLQRASERALRDQKQRE